MWRRHPFITSESCVQRRTRLRGTLFSHNWAMGGSARFGAARRALARRATRLIRLSERGRELRGVAKLRYKLQRALVPHGDVDPVVWAQLTSDV